MNKKTLAVALVLLCCMTVFPKEAPWGHMKKIHFYDSIQKYDKVLQHLNEIDFEGRDGRGAENRETEGTEDQ